MFFMSASVSCEAKPCMIGLARLPALNSVSCLTMYSACWADSLGLAGVPELPPWPWQATQTVPNFASPRAGSGLPVATVATALGAGAEGVAAAGPGAGSELEGAGAAALSPEAP